MWAEEVGYLKCRRSIKVQLVTRGAICEMLTEPYARAAQYGRINRTESMCFK
jgi:hypothetical protein